MGRFNACCAGMMHTVGLFLAGGTAIGPAVDRRQCLPVSHQPGLAKISLNRGAQVVHAPHGALSSADTPSMVRRRSVPDILR